MKKEDREKIYVKIFNFFLIIFLVSFITLYVSNKTGYFEYQQREKVVLTEEKIKQFEEDIKKGANIDLNTYLEDKKQNYNNKTSKLGLYISNKIEGISRSILEGTFNFINDFIN